jgi:hypothetical protein
VSLYDPATVARVAAAATVAFVLAGAVLTGPLLGVFEPPPQTDEIGDGTAQVGSVSAPTYDVVVTYGRFGTDTWYLRAPDATVRVDGTDGRSRLVARLRVPALSVDEVARQSIPPGGTGRYTLSTGSIALGPDRPTGGPFRGRLTVSVQSFRGDRTVFNETVTVEVAE